MVASCSRNESSKRARHKGQCLLQLSHTSHTLSHPPYFTGHRETPCKCAKVTRMNSKRQKSLETILEAGFYYLKISFQMKVFSTVLEVYYSPIFLKKNFPSPHCMACRMLGSPKEDWTWPLGNESRDLSTGPPGNFILNMVIWDQSYWVTSLSACSVTYDSLRPHGL